jgi:hypothetical protein
MGATGAVKRPLTTGLPSGFGGKPGWQASRRSRSPRSPCGWCVPPTFSRISIGSRVRPHRVASDKSTLDHQPGRRALRDRHGRGNVAVEMGVRQYHRRSPYVSFSTTAARPGKRHGHPRRGRQAGLRSEYRHPLRSAGLEFLCLPASAEPHGGAARIRLFRTRRNERGSDIPTWVPPDAPPRGRVYGQLSRERLHPARVRAPRTAGPRHILLDMKRGLVKLIAGYRIVRIAEESNYLARLWRDNRPLPPSRRSAWWPHFLDTEFLRLAAHDPRLPLALLRRVMGAVPLAQLLRFIDEDLPPRQLLPLVRTALPVVLGKQP